MFPGYNASRLIGQPPANPVTRTTRGNRPIPKTPKSRLDLFSWPKHRELNSINLPIMNSQKIAQQSLRRCMCCPDIPAAGGLALYSVLTIDLPSQLPSSSPTLCGGP